MRPKDFKVSDQILPQSESDSEPSDGAGTNADANEELPPDELSAGELADRAWARKDIAMITSSRKWH